jgi:aspartate racemase
MKEQVVGILGGMGPEATRDLFAHITRLTPVTRDQDHLHVIIDSFAKIPDRTAYIVGDGEDPLPAMLDGGRRLERADADFLIIPCISAHYFIEQLRAELRLPILSAFEETAKAIRAYPIHGEVGLLGTDGTVQSGKFAAVLSAHGLETLVPDADKQKHVMEGIYTVKADPTGERRDQCQELFRAAAVQLIRAGAWGIIAGCTEIPLALKAGDITVPLFDPVTILAKAAVARAKGSQPG